MVRHILGIQYIVSEENLLMDLKFTIKCIKNDNIFAILGQASHALDLIGEGSKIKEMQNRVWKSGSYFDALEIIQEYVNIEYEGDEE